LPSFVTREPRQLVAKSSLTVLHDLVLQSLGLYLTSSEGQRATLSKVTVDAIAAQRFAQGGHGPIKRVMQGRNRVVTKSLRESPVAYREQGRSPATITTRSPKSANGLLNNGNT
jgi:N-methylhydantoinase A/oxoprolinase/acetone carboxylase beta subunit